MQNKLQAATPLLPAEVQQQGLRVTKPTRNFLIVLGFNSTDNSMSGDDLANFVASNVQDAICAHAGRRRRESVRRAVRDAHLARSGQARHLRRHHRRTCWRRSARRTCRSRPARSAACPRPPGRRSTPPSSGPPRLTTPEEFRDILLRVNTDGSRLRIRDVARVSLDAENFVRDVKYNGQPATAMAIRLAIGANALDTVNAIHATLDRLEPFFPPGVQMTYPVDTTPFVRTSIREVAKTLFEAIVLVFLVMYLFLQNLRATLIPTIAVPVVMLGTFGVLAAFGYSINTLTMFGMALSIGLLVDDAIVVVENVERVMAEEGLSPREATRKSMDQITGALVGIALVLAAVFVPMAFFGGSIGVIYRQFSITIVSAMVLSVLVALILTPALCATLLKAPAGGEHRERGGFFGWFNRAFARSNRAYVGGVRGVLTHNRRYLAVYAALVVVLGLLFVRIPTAFLPDEDRRLIARHRADAARRHARAHRSGARAGAQLLHDAGKGRRRWRAGRGRVQFRRHRARTWACCSSS